MLVRRRIATLVALCGAAAGLAATGPTLAASAMPVGRVLPAARAARSVLAASVSAAAALPSTAGTQLTHDIQKAVTIADGSGVTLAVLSTGVDPATPGLAGRVTIGPDLTGSAHPVTIVGSLVASLVASNGSGGLVNPYGALTEAARLVKLSGAAASPAVAAGTPAGQDPATAFREGPPLPAIAAVHHSTAKLAAYGATVVIGLVCLIGAFLLRRSRARGATGTVRPAPGGTSEQFAEP